MNRFEVCKSLSIINSIKCSDDCIFYHFHPFACFYGLEIVSFL